MPRLRLAALLGVIASLAVALADHLPAPSLSTASSPPTAKPRGLDPALRSALREVRADGLRFTVTSGRRTRARQEQLFREAVFEHGSEAEAARWVARPETSAHVSGDAVDIGPPEAAAWLAANGARYGLCQIYANEPWHFELRAGGCPPLYPDPTYDPRMRVG